jgi:cell division transport system permease protein
MGLFTKKDRKLGVAEEAARYDLPLHNCAGSGFLTLLVALMSFLAMMALTGSFVLNGISDRWSAGLENQATIEISARKSDGGLRSSGDIQALEQRIAGLLSSHPNIREHSILSRDEVVELVSPWLGADASMEDMPLPGLISAKLKISTDTQVAALEKSLRSIDGDVRLDTHESWLGDILRLAGSLRLAAVFVTLMIGFTTVIAVAGAVRSRMAEFRKDIELLHLMGASDNYISRQFQRHNVILALRGSVMGLSAGAVTLLALSVLSQSAQSGLVPTISLSAVEMLGLASLAGAACLIAFAAARFTVLRTLSAMP